MAGCVLQVVGEELDPAGHELRRLRPYMAFRRGDVGYAGRVHETGSMCFLVSEESDLEHQLQDALHFLQEHRLELSELLDASGVESGHLDFGYGSRLGEGVAVQVDLIPVELIELAAQLGLAIMLSLYPRLRPPTALGDHDDGRNTVP